MSDRTDCTKVQALLEGPPAQMRAIPESVLQHLKECESCNDAVLAELLIAEAVRDEPLVPLEPLFEQKLNARLFSGPVSYVPSRTDRFLRWQDRFALFVLAVLGLTYGPRLLEINQPVFDAYSQTFVQLGRGWLSFADSLSVALFQSATRPVAVLVSVFISVVLLLVSKNLKRRDALSLAERG